MPSNKSIIPIMHCFNDNYVIPASVSFLSMLENANPAYFYRLYVLHTDISKQNQSILNSVVSKSKNASLEFVDMNHKFENVFDRLKVKGHYAKEVLYKLLAPSIFPQYKQIIITDVDVVFSGDIAEIWGGGNKAMNISPVFLTLISKVAGWKFLCKRLMKRNFLVMRWQDYS